MNRFEKLKLAVLSLVSALALLSSTVLADVEWAKGSFEEILSRAAKENKHVFIDFYAVWCGPCKMLDKTTYRDEKVVEFLNGIVPVKYDAEKGEGKELAEKFKIKAYPTLVLLDPHGKEIDRYLGYLDGKSFLQVMRDYMRGINTIRYFEDRLEKKPDDLAVLFKLGEKYTNISDEEKAGAYLQKIIELDPENRNGYTDKAHFNLGDLYYSNRKYEKAADFFRKVMDGFPESDRVEQAFQMLARTYDKLGEEEKAVSTYKRLIARKPEDPKVLNAFAWFCASRKIAVEEAIPYAEKAVELSNGDPGMMDTLAELYYARGDYDTAIAIEEEAAKKDPEDSYLKEQIIKYLKVALEKARQRR